MIDWRRVRAERAVYEDDAALVIDKAHGVVLTGSRDGDDLMSAARRAGEFVMPAHRIDAATSGLVLLARSRPAHAHLTQQFRDRDVDKAYLAIVTGTALPARATIDLPLAEGRKGRVRVAGPRDQISFDEWSLRWSLPPAARDGGVDATTSFERWAEGRNVTLLCARPRTGRRHQIRVHCAWIGHAVIGDRLFGVAGDRLALHSWRLSFESPATDDRVQAVVVPDDSFWRPLEGTYDPEADLRLTAVSSPNMNTQE